MKTNILKAALFTPISKGRWGLPVIAWSNPGEGKTSVIEEIAADFGLVCTVLSPGEMGEGAFGVIPVPDKSGVIKYPPPEWITRHAEAPGLVFIDEMSSTPPALQPPLLGLLFARRIGGATLSGRTRLLGAANPPEVAAGGFELAPPVANRCGHIDWTAPTPEEHATFMMRAQSGDRGDNAQTMSAEVEEARVLEAWPGAWAQAVGLETAFLHRRPALKNACPKMGDAKAGRAWPSDRSWEHATRALASASVHGLPEAARDEFVSAFIGAGAANEFFAYIQEIDLPDPAALLDGRAKFKHEKTRIDRTFAVLNACAALIAPSSAVKRDERALAFWAFIGELWEEPTIRDALVPSVSTVTKARLHAKGGQTAIKVLAKMNDLLKAAGINIDNSGI